MKISHILSILIALAIPAIAEEIKGEATCAKCDLKIADKCQMAITVDKNGKKETILVAQNDVSKGFHKQICKETKNVVAEGTISEKDGKKLATLTKVEVAK